MKVALVEKKLGTTLIGREYDLRQSVAIEIGHADAATVIKVPVGEDVEVSLLLELVLEMNSRNAGREAAEKLIGFHRFVARSDFGVLPVPGFRTASGNHDQNKRYESTPISSNRESHTAGRRATQAKAKRALRLQRWWEGESVTACLRVGGRP